MIGEERNQQGNDDEHTVYSVYHSLLLLGCDYSPALCVLGTRVRTRCCRWKLLGHSCCYWSVRGGRADSYSSEIKNPHKYCS